MLVATWLNIFTSSLHAINPPQHHQSSFAFFYLPFICMLHFTLLYLCFHFICGSCVFLCILCINAFVEKLFVNFVRQISLFFVILN